VALPDLLDLPATTGKVRRLAKTMRAMGFVPLKSRRLMPGGFRETTIRGWARPIREPVPTKGDGLSIGKLRNLSVASWGRSFEPQSHPGRSRPSLDREAEDPDVFQNPPESGFWGAAHSSIRIQEGEAFYIDFITFSGIAADLPPSLPPP
jgi:hypothetical protein